MKKSQTYAKPKQFSSREWIAGVSVLIVALSGGTGWWTWQTRFPFLPVEQQGLLTRLQPTKGYPQAYWLQIDHKQQIHLVPKPVSFQPETLPELALRQSLNHLLQGSLAAEVTTTIPPGTRLLNLQVTPAGTYINLSREFGQGGGSASMIYRVAQVIYTATSLNPDAKVFLSIEGQLIDQNHPLGGEGLILKQPMTRQEFAQNLNRS